MNISKFVNDADKPFHSSGFAEVANGSQMGATSAETFNRRYQIDQNRKLVQKYRDSNLARTVINRDTVGQRTDEAAPHAPQANAKSDTTRQKFNAVSTPRLVIPPRKFSEPKGRDFNPFS
jgi:hypothetical protein